MLSSVEYKNPETWIPLLVKDLLEFGNEQICYNI